MQIVDKVRYSSPVLLVANQTCTETIEYQNNMTRVLGTKFYLIQTILNFWTKLAQKG